MENGRFVFANLRSTFEFIQILFVLHVACATVVLADSRVVEIACGKSWVSPYWGYSTPKIVCDGNTYYTAGLWGDAPETSYGILYRLDGDRWIEGAKLPNIYQPATLLLDRQKRLIAIYNMQEKPAVVLRAKQAGVIDSFETLSPPDMTNGYYLGAAIQNETLYLAYASIPSYSMFVARMDLTTQVWSKPIQVSQGQIETKPKTAWTYPLLVPDAQGLHFAASSCPDGGDGNTYNKVIYLYIPHDSERATIEELVAESPIGSNAYAMDMTIAPDGAVHVVHMWNARKYGDPLPADAAKEGVYDSVRDAASGKWSHTYLSPICIAAYWRSGDALSVITQESGALVNRDWQPATQGWSQPSTLLDAASAPTVPSFMDVLTASSGSDTSRGIAVVTDGVTNGTERIVWSLLPR